MERAELAVYKETKETLVSQARALAKLEAEAARAALDKAGVPAEEPHPDELVSGNVDIPVHVRIQRLAEERDEERAKREALEKELDDARWDARKAGEKAKTYGDLARKFVDALRPHLKAGAESTEMPGLIDQAFAEAKAKREELEKELAASKELVRTYDDVFEKAHAALDKAGAPELRERILLAMRHGAGDIGLAKIHGIPKTVLATLREQHAVAKAKLGNSTISVSFSPLALSSVSLSESSAVIAALECLRSFARSSGG